MKKNTIIASVTITCLIMAGALLLSATCVRGVTSDQRSTQRAMSDLRSSLLLHVQEYGTLPEESADASVLEILCGKNPRKLRFYSAAPDQVRNGQLLDSWGHAFLFQKTTDNIVIRSAGKDGLYHTQDDLPLALLG